MPKPPKPTRENVRIVPHPTFGFLVQWPASKSGKSVYSTWRRTIQEAEMLMDSLIAGTPPRIIRPGDSVRVETPTATYGAILEQNGVYEGAEGSWSVRGADDPAGKGTAQIAGRITSDPLPPSGRHRRGKYDFQVGDWIIPKDPTEDLLPARIDSLVDHQGRLSAVIDNGAIWWLEGMRRMTAKEIREQKPQTVEERLLSRESPVVKPPLEERILAIVDAMEGICYCQDSRTEKHDLIPPCSRRRMVRDIMKEIQNDR